jgi:hypothetical protein
LPTIADLVATRWRFLLAGNNSFYGLLQQAIEIIALTGAPEEIRTPDP